MLLVAYELDSMYVGSLVSGDWLRKLIDFDVSCLDMISTICGHGTSVCSTLIPICCRLDCRSVPVNSS